MADVRPNTSFDEIFQSAIEIEGKAGNLYRKFAELFSNFPKAVDFWKGMEQDEGDHAKWLSEIKESLSEEQLSSYADYDFILKVHDIKKALEEYSKEKIENLNDAYEIANEIESSEVNNLFRLLAHKFIPIEEKRRVILAEINHHQLKVMDFPKTFGDRILREEMKAEEN